MKYSESFNIQFFRRTSLSFINGSVELISNLDNIDLKIIKRPITSEILIDRLEGIISMDDP